MIQQTDAVTHSILERLVESGLVEGRGHTRARRYHLSATVYRQVGQQPEYVRRRGFEQPQMKQMILNYAYTHSRVTRREVMDLCRVNANQAGYLLRCLVEAGHLERVGMGRSAFYRALDDQKKR